MKAIFLTPEEKRIELDRLGQEALENGGIKSSDLVQMINEDRRKIREEAEIRLNNLNLCLDEAERNEKLNEIIDEVFKEMFPS